MRILLGILLLLAFSSTAHAQPALRREMARASFLVGKWEGPGWAKYSPDGGRRLAHVTAEGQPILAGVALSWTSVAQSVPETPGVAVSNDVHLRFHRDSSQYRVSFEEAMGRRGDGWARVGECELLWGNGTPARPGGDLVRFTIRVDAENRLTETGERSSDGGRTWWQFYGAEMTGPAGGGCRASAAAADGCRASAAAADGGSTHTERSQ